ncbi:formin-binding protein 4 isoform X2 [Anguilla anguilla]|uniref:formin-binding protein 4 isoform X2 n=1 Tax=Anguilla anguilla TaxID=7936 RepID=UPI0015A7E0F6|nr:formin-binding protein 4 isoform X2 [Anguilla anguilla]
MDGRKLQHFVCFAVTMGLVACASGNLNSSPDANSPDTVLQNGAESTMEPQVNSTVNSTTTELDTVNSTVNSTTTELDTVNSTVNSTTTELDTTSSFKSSGPAPSNAVTPSNCPNVKHECKSCTTAEQPVPTHQKALFLIIAGALLFTCVVLLVTVTALACEVSHLRGRLRGSRPAQSNGAGLWAGGRAGGDVAGVGVAETSVMLEEVTPVQNKEEADRGPTAAAAAGTEPEPEPEPEPAPAADPDPVESPKMPTADKA